MMENSKSFYVHLISHKNKAGNSEFASPLTIPIFIPVYHNLFVGACNVQFIDNTTEKNIPSLQFAICIPKYLPRKPASASDPSQGPLSSISTFLRSFLELGVKRNREISFNEPSPYLNIERIQNKDAGRVITFADFIQSSLELGNYGPSQLVVALNSEIRAKFPASFNPNKCRFYYNHIIDRIQLQIDGGESSTAKSDRCTLMIFNPLSRILGYTKSTSVEASFSFGAPIPSAGIPQTLEDRHATPTYAPDLKRSRFFYLYMSSLEPQVSSMRLF